MARPIRVEFPDAHYWITSRTNSGAAAFASPEQVALFCETLEEAVARFGLKLFAYAVLPTSYELFVATPLANLSQAIGWFQSTLTIRYNRRLQHSGHVFCGRFKAILVSPDLYGSKLIVRINHLPESMDLEGELQNAQRTSAPVYMGTGESSVTIAGEWQQTFAADGGYSSARQRIARQSAFDPARETRRGLMLGDDALWERVAALIGGKRGVMESRWRQNEHQRRVATALAGILNLIPDEDIRIWARIRLGGERPGDLARECQYADGSGITHLLRRIDRRRATDPELARVIETIEESVRSGLPSLGGTRIAETSFGAGTPDVTESEELPAALL